MKTYKTRWKEILVGTTLAILFTACAGFASPLSPLTGISPASVVAGSGAFTLTVTGNSFTDREEVLWNGSVRATSYIDRQTLSASITAADVASAGTATVAVANGALQRASAPLNFTIAAPAPPATASVAPLQIGTVALAGGTVGTAYSATLSATGGTSPYTWSLASGSLPAGLTLSSSGVISGTPAAGGTSVFSVTATDSAGSPQAATQAESVAVVAQGAATLTPPPQAAGYTLQFSDNFNPLSLSPTGSGNYTWFSPGIWWDGTTTYGNISASNSLLTLNWANGQSTGNTSIATASPSGCSSTQPCGTWRYGYFEASLAWDPVQGAWPAFWMIPKQQIQNSSNMGEIDIFEGQGNTPNAYYGTYHEWQNGTTDIQNNSNSNSWTAPSGTDFTTFHTYGLLWTPGSLTWYFDNQPVISASYSGTTGASWFDNNDFYMILGSQVNGWGNNTGATGTIPLNVQWVHVWQSTPLQ